jgi:hypothetical protein
MLRHHQHKIGDWFEKFVATLTSSSHLTCTWWLGWSLMTKARTCHKARKLPLQANSVQPPLIIYPGYKGTLVDWHCHLNRLLRNRVESPWFRSSPFSGPALRLWPCCGNKRKTSVKAHEGYTPDITWQFLTTGPWDEGYFRVRVGIGVFPPPLQRLNATTTSAQRIIPSIFFNLACERLRWACTLSSRVYMQQARSILHR